MERKSFTFGIKSLTDEGTFEGYASVFGNVDLGKDVVVSGAFARSIAGEGMIPILWNHDSSEVIGKTLTLSEDSTGLYVTGELNLNVQKGREAYELLKQGALQGLSIGYGIDKSSDTKDGIRHLEEVTLYEYSLTAFPMNRQAMVTAVKSETDEIVQRIEALEQKLAHINNTEPPTEEKANEALVDVVGFFRGLRN